MPEIAVQLDEEDFQRLCDYAASVWDYPDKVAASIIYDYLEEQNG